jgi:hypothetical protein
MENLDTRERFIVEKRLMADPEDELSLAELGRRLGVSRERARQLEARAKRKLKTRLVAVTRADAGGWLEEPDVVEAPPPSHADMPPASQPCA